MSRKKSHFITFEGGEGAGKTTVINQVYQHFSSVKMIVTREPGGIPIAEEIRSVILNHKHTNMDGITEALLYAAARRQHLVEKVKPALENGYTVLCDRFIDSSLAYQGHARGLGIDEVLRVNQFAIGELMPDLTLYFDIDPEIALRRIQSDQSRQLNRLDMETIEFHQKVREGFHLLLQKYPDRIVKIDASMPLKHVVEASIIQIKQHIQHSLGEN